MWTKVSVIYGFTVDDVLSEEAQSELRNQGLVVDPILYTTDDEPSGFIIGLPVVILPNVEQRAFHFDSSEANLTELKNSIYEKIKQAKLKFGLQDFSLHLNAYHY
jgi:hypothetical protein